MKTLRLVWPVLSLLAVAACGRTAVREVDFASVPDSAPMIGRPTPAPQAALTDPQHPAQRTLALQYADSLAFAEDTGASHVHHGQYDRNLLDRSGTIGTVAPEVGMHRMRPEDLRRGRIQLRVWIEPGPGYRSGFGRGKYGRSPGAPYKFPPGVSYVWVDRYQRYQPTRGDTAGTARIVVIPVDTTFVVDTATVLVFSRRDALNQAIARWSPAACWDCMRASWCSLK